MDDHGLVFGLGEKNADRHGFAVNDLCFDGNVMISACRRVTADDYLLCFESFLHLPPLCRRLCKVAAAHPTGNGVSKPCSLKAIKKR